MFRYSRLILDWAKMSTSRYILTVAIAVVASYAIYSMISNRSTEIASDELPDLVPADSIEVRRGEAPGLAGQVESNFRPIKEDRVVQASGQTPNQEPVDVIEFREARGYYVSGGNDVGAKHPYEFYDIATLESLASANDGLAQLILADKLYERDSERANSLYLSAAVNGKTAGLVNMASSRLQSRPGKQGFGFQLTDEHGAVTESYVDALQYYAAAELLGDFVGSELLAGHMSSGKLNSDPSNIARICAKGNEIANRIKSRREQQWGAAEQFETPTPSIQVPRGVCD